MKFGYVAIIIFVTVIVLTNGETLNDKLGILLGFGGAALGLFLLVSLVNFLFRKAPDSFQIHEDGIRIPLLPFFAIKIKYEDIEDITKESISDFGFRTIYIGTKMWGSVLIKKKRGYNYAITPRDPDAFIAEVKRRMEIIGSK